MELKDIQSVSSKDEATNIAIEWQQYNSNESMSYNEMLKYQSYFQALAEKFDLVDEFKENGII